MTYQDIASMLETVGIPFAYYQFAEGSGQNTPFITFYYPGDNDMHADNVNYAVIRPLTIELYTDNKDFGLEAAVEAMLTDHDLTFTREEDYIDSERMYMITYRTEVNINGQ